MAKYCVLFAAGADNANANFNNIIFTIKDAKLYLPVVTLSAWENMGKTFMIELLIQM